MTNEQFQDYRSTFQHFIAGLMISEIRAFRKTFHRLRDMNIGQVNALIEDLNLMESYKIKTSKADDEFNRIMKGIQS